MNELLGVLGDSLRDTAGVLIPLAVALASVGFAAMALIQLAKDLLPIRRWYQYYELWEGWFRPRLKPAAAEAAAAAKAAEAAEAAEAAKDPWERLLDLAGGGYDEALFALPAEELSGRLFSALDIVLAYPWKEEMLLRVFAQGAGKDDMELLLTEDPVARDEKRFEIADARHRVGELSRRSLDGVMLAIGARWRWCLRAASIAVSTLIILVVLVVAVHSEELPADRKTLGLGVLLAVGGGFLAPIARDLVAALKRLRTGE